MDDKDKIKLVVDDKIITKARDQFIKDIDITSKFRKDLGKIQEANYERFRNLALKLQSSAITTLSTQLNTFKIPDYTNLKLSSYWTLKMSIDTDFLDTINSVNTRIQSTIRPLTNYLEVNKDKIQKFQESTEKVVDQLCEIHDISEDEAIELIDVLTEDGRIVTYEDWSFELIEDGATDIGDEEKEKRKTTLNNKLAFLQLVFTIFNPFNNGVSNIDNSTQNIENQYINGVHYHITEEQKGYTNEYIVVNNTYLYNSESVESEVLFELNSGDKINRIIVDDNDDSELILVVVLGEVSEIEYSGWIKIDDVTLID